MNQPSRSANGAEGHHIWCNYWGTPVDTCVSCKTLKKFYPEDGKTPDELQREHFPDALKREGT
jgi:hypothetical protein